MVLERDRSKVTIAMILRKVTSTIAKSKCIRRSLSRSRFGLGDCAAQLLGLIGIFGLGCWIQLVIYW